LQRISGDAILLDPTSSEEYSAKVITTTACILLVSHVIYISEPSNVWI